MEAVTEVTMQKSEDCQTDGSDTKLCNHLTNGSFAAYAEGFYSVTGREPELWTDYYSCCRALYSERATVAGEGPLTDAHLDRCRTLGEEAGRKPWADADNWKILKLCRKEIETLVRWHVSHQVEEWAGRHVNSWMDTGWWTECHLDYFALVLGEERVTELMRDVWRSEVGDLVKRCGCRMCADKRGFIFPDLERQLGEQLQDPSWLALLQEVRQQFPGLTDEEAEGLVKTAIQRGMANVPAAEAARQIIEKLTLDEAWQRGGISSKAPMEEQMEYYRMKAEGSLKDWRDPASCDTPF